MTADEFIDKLIDAGWRSTCDAQHEGASKLFSELQAMPLIPANRDPFEGGYRNIVKQIVIHVSDGNDFDVAVGSRYTGRLCWDEMLGTVASLTHPRINEPRYLMATEEEWAERRRLHDRNTDIAIDQTTNQEERKAP